MSILFFKDVNDDEISEWAVKVDSQSAKFKFNFLVIAHSCNIQTKNIVQTSSARNISLEKFTYFLHNVPRFAPFFAPHECFQQVTNYFRLNSSSLETGHCARTWDGYCFDWVQIYFIKNKVV